jgi:hypothetical protein
MYRPHTPVGSSQVVSFGYDAKSKILEVEFQRSAVYQYANVPEEVYQGMINAPSAGSYLNQKIKGIYDYKRA